MTEGIIIAVIGVLGGIVGVVVSNFFNFSHIKDSLKGNHTLQKAEEYHNLETKDIQETRSDIKEAKSSIGIVFTDVKLLSKDFNNYQNSIKQADSSEGAISSAIKSIENLAVNTGALKEDVTALKQENIQLISELDILNKKYESSLKENIALKLENDELIKLREQLEKQKDLDDSKEQSYEENEREDDIELER